MKKRSNKRTARRLFAVVAAVALALAITGCGEDDPETSVAGSTQSTAANESPTAATETPGPTADDSAEDSAANITESPNSEFVDEPPPIQISSGAITGYRVDEPTVVIAETQKEMNAIKRRHFSNGVKEEDIVPVSFNQDRQLVALFMPVSAKGSLVAIQSVASNGDTVKVSATLVLPGEDCKVSGSRSRPFSWVETRTLSGDVEVEVERVKSSAC